MSTKNSIKPILLFIPLGSPLWIYGIYQAFYRIENKSEAYFQNANLNFIGRVLSTKEIAHGAGYICLDLNSTTIPYYNPSDTLSEYFCIIRDNRAILAIDGIATFETGDVFIVKKDSSFQYNRRMDSLKWKSKLILVDWIDSPKSVDLCK
jgi:hypothetical protein